MKHTVVVPLLIGALVVAACGGTATPPSGAGMPNPASVFCENQGYTVEVRTSADGSQQGFCIFPDGTECDEWAFFRAECGPGTVQP